MEHEGYHLIRRLGTGGSGTVWLATDPLGGRVAIKMLHPGLAATEQARARLIREATTVNSIASAQVAHVLDVEADQTQPFVVSDFVDGPTLRELLARGPLPPDQVASLATVLCDVLHQVHAAHVVHRDIKPSNVIMSATGPVLIDFGIAMSVGDERLTSTGLVSGTPGFTAPELLRGHPSSPATDWWGWAATVLNAATGRPPFGPGQAALIRTESGQPDVDGLPAQVAAVLTSALAPDPARRPSPEQVCTVLSGQARWDQQAAAPTDLLPVQSPDKKDEDWATEQLPGRPSLDKAGSPQGFGTAAFPLATSVTTPSKKDEDFHTEVLPVMAPIPAEPTRTLPIQQPAAQSVHPFMQSQPEYPQPFTLSQPEYPQPQPQYPQVQAGFVPMTYSDTEPTGNAGMGGSGFLGENPEQTLWTEMPYVERRPRPAIWVIVAVLAALAAVPVFAGTTGVIATMAVLILYATLGASNSWKEHRRVRFGKKHRTDAFWTAVAAPWHLLKAAALTTLSLIPGILVGAVAWAGVRAGLEPSMPVPELTWFSDFLIKNTDSSGWTVHPVWQPICWAVLLVTLLVAALMPTSRPLRRGIQLSAQTLLAPWWARGIFVVLVAGVLVASWDVTTSSGLG